MGSMNSREKAAISERMVQLRYRDIEQVTAAADGTTALLYLYLQQKKGALSVPEAARTLRRTEQEILKARGHLQSLGIDCVQESKLPPPEELPEYGAEELSGRRDTDRGFRDVVAEAQRVLGRMLSGSDLKILFGIYDYLGLPAEVIMLLLNHCVEICAERYGPGRPPTMHMVEKEAYVWANREICTMGRAEAYLQRKRQQKDLVSQIQRELSIRDRALTPTERKYIESWIEMGFGPEAVAEAYDRTVIKTGGLRWAYLNSILKNWHEKGLHTLEEVTGESRRRSGAQVPAGDHSYGELERLEKLLNPGQSGKTER
jgi:DnaD/phage-associated family protein